MTPAVPRRHVLQGALLHSVFTHLSTYKYLTTSYRTCLPRSSSHPISTGSALIVLADLSLLISFSCVFLTFVYLTMIIQATSFRLSTQRETTLYDTSYLRISSSLSRADLSIGHRPSITTP